MRQSEAKANQAVWTERIQAWRSSGVSAAQFVRGKDFTASALLYWSKRVEAEGKARFLRVVPAGSVPAPEEPRSDLVLEVRGVAIRIRREFDPKLLVDVIRVLTGSAQ